MNPASWSSRQKSFRGLAKCAAAAADTRPGLIPQKTTARSGARTSGTALASTPLRPPGVAARPVVLRSSKSLTQLLSEQAAARTLGLGLPDHRDGRFAVAVETCVALGLAQGPEPRHARNVASGPDGAVRFAAWLSRAPRVFEYAATSDGRTAARAAGESTVAVPESWAPEHLVLAGLRRLLADEPPLPREAGRVSRSTASGEASGTVTRARGRPVRVRRHRGARLDVALQPGARRPRRPAREGRAGLLRRRVADREAALRLERGVKLLLLGGTKFLGRALDRGRARRAATR